MKHNIWSAARHFRFLLMAELAVLIGVAVICAYSAGKDEAVTWTSNDLFALGGGKMKRIIIR